MKKKFLGLLLVLCMLISLFTVIPLPVSADVVAPGVGDTVTFIDADWKCISIDTDNSDGYTGYKLLRNDPLEMVNFDEDSDSFADSDIYNFLNSNYITSTSIFPGERSSIMLDSWFYGTVADDDANNMEANIGLLTLTEYNAIKDEDWYVPAGEDEKWWLSTSDGGNICTAVYSEGTNTHTLTAPNTSGIWVRPSLWLNMNTNLTSFVLTDGKYVATYPFTTPGFNPAGGTVTFPRDITISGYGADHVYYTTDGTTPATSTTGSSLEYTGPITISSNVTINALSTKEGYYPSPVATASYMQESSALTELVLSGTPTGFAFASNTLTYNGVKVANGVSSVTVTPTGAGTITVNGTEVVSGTASVPILLTVGEEESISVVVSQTGKSSTTYTINVTRRSNIWDGVTTEQYTGEGNSEADPYIIDTAEKLAYLAAQVNGGETYNGKYFKMTADITLNDTSNWQTWDASSSGLNEWTPIGDYDNAKAFEGNFNGDGHVVKGVYISSESDHQGLFSYSGYGVVIKNLGIAESYIKGRDYVGGLVGGGINTTLENCYNTAKITGRNYVGGIIGDNYRGTVKNSYNSCGVIGADYIGGLVGNNRSMVENCYNAALITGDNYVGGIVGQNIRDEVNFSYGIVQNCYNLGDVSGSSDVGGVAGKNENNIVYCYWLITAEQTVGGTLRLQEEKLSIGSNAGLATDVFSFTETQGQGTEPSTIIDSGGTYSNTTSLLGALIAYNTHEVTPGIWFAAPSLSVNGGYPILTGYSGGTGSVADPYLISTANDLQQFALTVNEGETYNGKYFKMTADIALNDTSNWQTWDEDTSGLNEWTPIGDDIDSGHIFNGVFDGDGHTVSGVYISDTGSDNIGLFGFVSGIIKNLGATQSFISGDEYVGGVAGRINNGIEYCWFSGTVKGLRYIGGVAGCIDGTAQYCFNMGTVSGMLGVGGVFGIIGESSISNCYNAGAVSGGYLVGGITSTQMENITDCYNSGVVMGLSIPELDDELALDAELPPDTHSPLYVGAIIGKADYPGQITGCCYDKQMSREAGVGGETESSDIAGTVGKRTVQMCDYMFRFEFGGFADWVFDNGLYPRLAEMDTTDAALVSAMPVRLQFTSDTVFEISKAVKSDFIVGTLPGFSWTSSDNSVISIDDGIAYLTRQSIDTTVILTATKNNVSKQVPLNILAAPPAINPESSNYDLNAPSDVTTTITWNRASSVTGITYNDAPLATPADYSVSGNTINIENAFIAGLSPTLNDEINLTITFNTGETATLTVRIVDGFVPITGITGVPTTATVGTPLTLTGTVAPADATNQTIIWSIADWGTTGATISGNTLTTTAAGTVTARATITNGLTASTDYTQDFAVSVNPIPTGTVTFNSNGTVYDTKTVNVGESIGSAAWPANPMRSSYTFGGWFTGENGTGTEFTSSTLVNSTITLYAKWTYSGGSGSTPPPPQRTITVTETSSEVFVDTSGTISAEANMENAFSNSVEVKVTDTADDVASFRLSAGDEAYPFDISLYIKGTNQKTEPTAGYAVTISLPIPENLVEKRTSLLVAHKSIDGTVTTLNSRLVQKDGVWYIVFEATEFSPYALVVRNLGSYNESSGVYNESSGVPYYTDAKGNKVFIGFAVNGKYIAPEGVTVSMMHNDKSFTDITGHWAASYIGFTTERELFLGTGGTNFSPEMGMTRAMFATVTGRLYERSFGGIAMSDTHSFIDCDYDAYYGKYVDWAAENEIIRGIGDGKFAPDTPITREQMAAILYRLADFLGVLPDGTDAALKYHDAASISSYAKNATLYCQTTGIIAGRTVGVFAPQDTATRAEVATIIQRFIEMVMK